MLSLFGFGKKRRSVKRKSVKKHHHAKPSATLLKLAEKYHVKVTKKVSGKRVYKKTSLIKKMVLRKARAMLKKMQKMQKKMAKHHKRGRKHVGRRHKRGRKHVGRRHKRSRRAGFGKRTRGRAVAHRKVSKAAAMKAFRSFYKRHVAGAHRMRFGNGGNPALSASMGYSFCPDGSGGVLGVNSTGLFPTPCGQTAAMGSMAATPPTTGSVVALYNAAAAGRAYAPAAAFGAKQSRRKRGSKSRVVCRRVRHRVRKYNVAGSPCNKLKKADCRGKKECLYVKRRGCRRSGRSHAAAVAAMAAPMPVAAAYGRRR
jgi:hypothetical protein